MVFDGSLYMIFTILFRLAISLVPLIIIESSGLISFAWTLRLSIMYSHIISVHVSFLAAQEFESVLE